MLDTIIGYHPGFSALLLRLAAGVIILAHAYPRSYGRKSGAPAGSPRPSIIPYLEFICGLLLAAGLMTRLSALLLAAITAAPILKGGWKAGLVSRPAEEGRIAGFELPLALVVMLLVVALIGSGKFSIDFAVLHQT